MANIISLTGSPFINNPIVAAIYISSPSGTLSFHRVKLQVIAALDPGDTDYTTIEMSSPCTNGETVSIDISSALRAVADNYEYSYEPTTYPRIKFQLKTWEEYMSDGEVHTTDVTYYPSSTTYLYGIMGGYTDYERMHFASKNGGVPDLLAYDFCRKPTTSPQVLCVGETFAYTNTFSKIGATSFNGYGLADIPEGPTSIAQEIVNEGSQQIGDVLIYALPADTSGNRYEFRFINGFGVLDSISVTSLRETDVHITSEFQVISRKETFTSFSRGINRKSNDYETWKLTSGPLDKYWHAWFIHEFLMSERVWIKVDSTWLPCHIITDETTTGFSPLDPELQEVTFSVRLDINGSLLNSALPPHVR